MVSSINSNFHKGVVGKDYTICNNLFH